MRSFRLAKGAVKIDIKPRKNDYSEYKLDIWTFDGSILMKYTVADRDSRKLKRLTREGIARTGQQIREIQQMKEENAMMPWPAQFVENWLSIIVKERDVKQVVKNMADLWFELANMYHYQVLPK